MQDLRSTMQKAAAVATSLALEQTHWSPIVNSSVLSCSPTGSGLARSDALTLGHLLDAFYATERVRNVERRLQSNLS